VLAQAQEPRAVFAEGVQTDGHGPAIRPQEFIALIADAIVLSILGWITAEEDLQAA
jgi:hypothetical protein